MHTKSHMLHDPGQKEYFDRSLGQTYLLILDSLPERQEATAAHSGDIGTGGSHFGELILPHGH